MKRSPLEGVRVIDLTHNVAGPVASELLGLMGAAMIKVEPVRAHQVRSAGGRQPPGYTGSKPYNAQSLFNQISNNRASISLDLSSERGRLLFLDLVRMSDVVIENNAPGMLRKYRVDYEDLVAVRPDLIFCSVPGFGEGGPWGNYRCYAVAIEPLIGLFSLTGYKDGVPMKAGCDPFDPIHANHAAGAVLAALLHRARTGRGQRIEVAHLESASNFVGSALMDYSLNRRIQTRKGNEHEAFVPHGAYRCSGEDRWLAISVRNDAEWEGLCRATGKPEWLEDPRFLDAVSRRRHRAELDCEIEAWTLGQEHRDAAAHLQAYGVPAGAVLNIAEVYEDPQARARGMFGTIEHREAGAFPFVGPPWTMSATPPRVARSAPCYAEDNHDVYTELLGLGQAEIEELYRDHIVADEPLRLERARASTG